MNDALPTEEQRRLFCQMMHIAFLDMRQLGWQGAAAQAADLADAFRNLPEDMYSLHFRWSTLRMFLEGYRRKHPKDGSKYLEILNRIETAGRPTAAPDVNAASSGAEKAPS